MAIESPTVQVAELAFPEIRVSLPAVNPEILHPILQAFFGHVAYL